MRRLQGNDSALVAKGSAPFERSCLLLCAPWMGLRGLQHLLQAVRTGRSNCLSRSGGEGSAR